MQLSTDLRLGAHQWRRWVACLALGLGLFELALGQWREVWRDQQTVLSLPGVTYSYSHQPGAFGESYLVWTVNYNTPPRPSQRGEVQQLMPGGERGWTIDFTGYAGVLASLEHRNVGVVATGYESYVLTKSLFSVNPNGQVLGYSRGYRGAGTAGFDAVSGQVALLGYPEYIHVSGPISEFYWPVAEAPGVEVRAVVPDRVGGVYVIGSRAGFPWVGYVLGLGTPRLLEELTLDFPGSFDQGLLVGNRLMLSGMTGEASDRQGFLWLGSPALYGEVVWRSPPGPFGMRMFSDVRGRAVLSLMWPNDLWEVVLVHPLGYVDARTGSYRLGPSRGFVIVSADHGGNLYIQDTARVIKTTSDLRPLWIAAEPLGAIGGMGDLATQRYEGDQFIFSRLTQAFPFSSTLGLGPYVGAADRFVAHVSLSSSSDGPTYWKQSLPLRDDRTIAFELPVSGTVVLRIKVGHWLSTSQTLSVAESGLQNVPIELVNGDVDGDDAIGLFDFLALRQAYGSRAGDSLWNPLADLDGDGHVGIGDFAILRSNYGRRGD